MVSSLSLLVAPDWAFSKPEGAVGIRPAAIYFWATPLIRAGSMIAQAAFPAEPTKNGLFPRNVATPGSRLGHAAGPGEPAFPACEKSPLSSAGVKVWKEFSVCF